MNECMYVYVQKESKANNIKDPKKNDYYCFHRSDEQTYKREILLFKISGNMHEREKKK